MGNTMSRRCGKENEYTGKQKPLQFKPTEKNLSSSKDYSSLSEMLKVLNLSSDSECQSALRLSDSVEQNTDMQSDYVEHEVQLFNTDKKKEIELEYFNCKKHPEHKEFILVDKFCMEDLPYGCISSEFYDLVRSLSDLTVRVCVEKTYQNVNLSPKKVIFASGRVEHVKTFLQNQDNLCPCRKCQLSIRPSASWGIIRVSTTAQLRVDETEVQRATCRLFYDTEDSPVVDLHVFKLDSVDESKDSCKLLCATCDMVLVNKLDKLVDAFINSWEIAFDKHFGDKDAEREKIAVIVSHPHGYYKHISIGKWSERCEQVEGDMVRTQYTYDTPTCPGSAGAHILIPNFSDSS